MRVYMKASERTELGKKLVERIESKAISKISFQDFLSIIHHPLSGNGQWPPSH